MKKEKLFDVVDRSGAEIVAEDKAEKAVQAVSVGEAAYSDLRKAYDFIKKLNLRNFSIEQGDGNIHITGLSDNGVVDAIITTSPHGQIAVMSNYNHVGLKSEYREDIEQLYAAGKTQAQIARMLNISQPYVSRLLAGFKAKEE